MATSTNLGLYLPTREDYISVKRDLSDNYEIIDAAVGGNTQGIAQIQSETDIVINGATSTSNVTIGQFVTVRNSSITGIVDGVYKALANVTAGTSFVAANLQAVTGGALNKIVSDTNAMIQQQENDMDIVVRGNTASVNVTAGQFVTVRDSTIANISDGVYKAANNVSSGVPFTDADLNDISSGALNELVSDLATLNEHIGSLLGTERFIRTASDYTTNNTYNTWVEHELSISNLGFSDVYACACSANGTSATYPHEARVYSFTKNKITYGVKGGWNGGSAGVTVCFLLCGK